jgi:hypothetical protein
LMVVTSVVLPSNTSWYSGKPSEVCKVGSHWIQRVPRGSHEYPINWCIPLPRCGHMAEVVETPQSENNTHVGTHVQTRRRLAPDPKNPSSMAAAALCRQIPKVGAQCVNCARWNLCGGGPVMGVSTAIGAGGNLRPYRNPRSMPLSFVQIARSVRTRKTSAPTIWPTRPPPTRASWQQRRRRLCGQACKTPTNGCGAGSGVGSGAGVGILTGLEAAAATLAPGLPILPKYQ